VVRSNTIVFTVRVRKRLPKPMVAISWSLAEIGYYALGMALGLLVGDIEVA
jgi:hypothetical protein